MKPTRLTRERRERIRVFFLHRVESCCLAEGARLLGISPGTLKREAEDDRRDAYGSRGEWRFTWRQLAYIALRRWSLAEIHEALGADAATALPSLLALRTVTVRLPEYIALALETVAAEDAMTVDDCLSHELVEFAGSVADRVSPAIPGFRHAYLWPAQE